MHVNAPIRAFSASVGSMNLGTSKKVSRRWPMVSGLIVVALAATLGAVILLRAGNLPLWFDQTWMTEVLEERTVWLEVPARFMDWFGGGWFGVVIVPVCIVILLLTADKRWGALFYAVAALLSVGAVQLLKALFDRPRPEDILVLADVGSFPSGHVANAATTAVVLALILQRWWIWVVGAGYIVLMALSRTYLGAHWLSDTVGGALIGVGVAVIVWAPFAYRVGRERVKP